jgi:alpha-D-ribose 1-methylphosphonate 5-phosphate C-P lyase
MLGYNYAFLDEFTKREIRRKILKAVAIPGYQVPFASREMPISKGWGTGGLQLTLSLIGDSDMLKVIDQGFDESVNAVNIKKLVMRVTSAKTTSSTKDATIIQTRHRIPEEGLEDHQIMVFQVPVPEPLRTIEPSEEKTRRMHAEGDYSKIWLYLYENIVLQGQVMFGAAYPVMVNGRYLMDPSPKPRWDVPKLAMAGFLSLFCAGREKRIYALPPYTRVEPLEFEDHPFEVENFHGAACSLCGSCDTYLTRSADDKGNETWSCSDTSFCKKIADLNRTHRRSELNCAISRFV